MGIFSTREQLIEIRDVICLVSRVPFFAGKGIPGDIMEHALAGIRGAKRLGGYDFVDVVDDENHFGWQVKSTLEKTPITWKRAKIPNRNSLIEESIASPRSGCKKLGNAIIDFCNDHALQSLNGKVGKKSGYQPLKKIAYARLILFPNGTALYFERLLCSSAKPRLFDSAHFTWAWSSKKNAKLGKKEQLQALHGQKSGAKWWAWHGRGENQLHFSAERLWWPRLKMPSDSEPYTISVRSHAILFRLPGTKLSFDAFTNLLRESI